MEDMDDLSEDIEPILSNLSGEMPTDCEKNNVTGKYHKQTYRKAWEDLPDFKGWLQEVEGQPNRAYCSYCQVSLFAHRLSLLKHTCTLKHQRATQKAILRENGLLSGNELSAPTSSQTQSSIGGMGVNLHQVKVPESISNGMTVTIIQGGTEPPIHLQLESDMTDADSNNLISDDDLGLNTSASIQPSNNTTSSSSGLTVPTVLPQYQMLAMAHQSNFPLSTHVLDTSKGKPVPQVPVSLYRLVEGRWTLVNESITNNDGRCSNLVQRAEFVAGRYKLHFDTDKYFSLEKKETLYPFVEIAFNVHAPSEHYHIPLLLSAFGYSTYRGS